MSIAYIGVGSNLGQRRRTIEDGIRELAVRVAAEVRWSPFFETAPVDLVDQPSFLNAVAELKGTLPPPAQLLEECLAVESKFKRERRVAKGPRTLDLDVLLYDDVVLDTPALVIPHPRLHLRRFALEPLAVLAPTLVHPVLRRTILEMLAELAGSDDQHVTRI